MDNKISLTIYIRGAKPISEDKCIVDPKNSYDNHTIFVEVKKLDKKTHKTFKATHKVTFQTRKRELIAQTINMSQEAYNNFISNDNCPSWISKGDWKRMSKRARLEEHMRHTCEAFGGVSYSYKVFDD